MGVGRFTIHKSTIEEMLNIRDCSIKCFGHDDKENLEIWVEGDSIPDRLQHEPVVELKATTHIEFKWTELKPVEPIILREDNEIQGKA